MVTNNKNKIIRPILSRFCLLYVPTFSKVNNLHVYNNRTIDVKPYKNHDYKLIKSVIDNIDNMNHRELFVKAKEFYEKCIEIENIKSYFFKKKILHANDMRLFASYNDFEFKLKYMMREIKDDILLIYIVLMFFRFNSVFSI